MNSAVTREHAIQSVPLKGGFVLSKQADARSNRMESECVAWVQWNASETFSSRHKKVRGRVGCFATLMALVACGLSYSLCGCAVEPLGGAKPSGLAVSPMSVSLGSIPLGKSTSTTVTLVNQGTGSVNVVRLNITGQSFSLAGENSLPISIAAGDRYDLLINFTPAASGPVSGQLTITSDDSSGGTMVISLSGAGVTAVQDFPTLSDLSCSNAVVVGALADTCTATISTPAPSNGFSVILSSDNAAVSVSSSALVPANATSVQFTASVSPVLTAESASLTASAGTISKSFSLSLAAFLPTLSAGSASVDFGTVALNTRASQNVSLTSVGSAPVVITGATASGASFTLVPSSFPVILTPGQTLSLSVQFDPIDSGVATGQLSVTSNSSGGSFAAIPLTGAGMSATTFSYTGSPLVSTLVPPNSSAPLSGSFFGMTIHHSATPFPAFPVSTLRFWDVTAWSDIEPSSGQFVWTRMDSTTVLGKQKGVIDYIFTLGSVPTWASTNPSAACTGGNGLGACAPPDMNAFDDFVSHVVQRYCGTVKYYETWNEPNNTSYWIGTNAQLLTVAQHLYKLAKDPANCGCTGGVCSPNGGANPNQILLPSISHIDQPILDWLDSYLATAGAAYPYADVVAFHGYGATIPEQIVPQLQSLNQTIAKHGLSSLPLWNTEASWGAPPYVDQDQASWLMRYHVALAVSGVSRFIWYAYDNCGWGTLWEAPWCVNPQMPTGQVTAPGEAYGVIEDWLIGATLADCQLYQNGLWVCELQRPENENTWMIWSSTGDDITVPIPPGSGLSSYRDWQNNVVALSTTLTVGQMPVLLGDSTP